MIVTLSTPSGFSYARHWVTHESRGQHFLACGMARGIGIYPTVEMPAAMLDCPRCVSQRERYELATLTIDAESR